MWGPASSTREKGETLLAAFRRVHRGVVAAQGRPPPRAGPGLALQRHVLRALPRQGLKVRQTCAVSGVTMGMDRREMVKAAAAAILAAPLSAFAFGDSPKTVLAHAPQLLSLNVQFVDARSARGNSASAQNLERRQTGLL